MSWPIDASPQSIGPSSPSPQAQRSPRESSALKKRVSRSAREHLPSSTLTGESSKKEPGRLKRLSKAEAGVEPATKRTLVFSEANERGVRASLEPSRGVPLDVWSFSDGKGDTMVVVTPGLSVGKRTIAMRVGDSYHKFHNITCLSAEEAAKDPSFKSEEWVRFGEEYILRADLEAAIAAIPNRQLQLAVQSFVDLYLLVPGRLRREEVFLSEKVARAVSTASSPHGVARADEDRRSESLYEEVMEQIRTGRLKLSSMKGWKRRHTIVPVLKRRLGSGTTKEVGLEFPLLEGRQGDLPEEMMAVAKVVKEDEESSPAKTEKIASLRKEVWLSEIFRFQGVPHVLDIHEISRGDGEIGAMLPFCRLGDLFDVIRRIAKEAIPDAQRRQLLFRLGIHVGETLSALHARGYVHGDVKSANVFVDGSADFDPDMEAHLADFDCTSPFKTKSSVAGTFPPPEAARDLSEGKTVALAPTIDAWAYGVLLFELFTGRKDVVTKLSFDNGAVGIIEGRTKVLAALPQNDPVSDVIRGLLSLSPGRRLSVADAEQRLQHLAS